MLKAEWSSKAGQAMKPKVYVETTILSYLAARPSRQPVTAGRQVITRQWWETERKKYNLVVSEVVEAECERGDAESASRRRELLGEVSLFPLNERILELARLLVVPGAIPEKAGPDAVHIAAAAVEECEFLLTWNFRHIANVRIRREVERILLNHGYTKTTICTPEELI
jgi:predicted nucleic acid-binding protein